MDFVSLKLVHVSAVAVSYALFVLRGIWMMRGSKLLHQRWIRFAPHVVDTVLLASAIALVVMLRQYPFVDNWLTAKVIGLLVYIGMGTIAIKRGRTRAVRITAWLGAQAVFFYIVAVAIARNPLPFPG